jgi:diadenylate cyclase
MGLRHRASLGISEVSDAIAIIVSEETGRISLVTNGRFIRGIDPERLSMILNESIGGNQSGSAIVNWVRRLGRTAQAGSQ